MAKFTLTIDMSNDDFGTDPHKEVAKQLRNVADRLSNDFTLTHGDSGSIKDTNGNTVGEWKVTRSR